MESSTFSFLNSLPSLLTPALVPLISGSCSNCFLSPPSPPRSCLCQHQHPDSAAPYHLSAPWISLCWIHKGKKQLLHTSMSLRCQRFGKSCVGLFLRRTGNTYVWRLVAAAPVVQLGRWKRNWENSVREVRKANRRCGSLGTSCLHGRGGVCVCVCVCVCLNLRIFIQQTTSVNSTVKGTVKIERHLKQERD